MIGEIAVSQHQINDKIKKIEESQTIKGLVFGIKIDKEGFYLSQKNRFNIDRPVIGLVHFLTEKTPEIRKWYTPKKQ